MRRLGAMPYMMPLHNATESSTMPKSVMKTTVGGGCRAGCCARRGLAAISNKARPKPNIRADLSARVNVLRIRSELYEKTTIMGSKTLAGNRVIQEGANDVQCDSRKIPRPFQEARFRQPGHRHARREAAGHSRVVRFRRPTRHLQLGPRTSERSQRAPRCAGGAGHR